MNHLELHNYYCQKTNEVPELKALRDFVEQKAFGFGERSFYWMWKLIVDELPDHFSLLEIGVFRGQTLALVQMLAQLAGKTCSVYGVTPLDTTDGHWESDYKSDIHFLHNYFALNQPTIIEGLSTEPEIIEAVKVLKSFDVVYIDGGHTYDVAKSDIINYAPLAKQYLVIDDCCNDLDIPFGMFPGIQSVTDAVIDTIETPHSYSVVHNKVWDLTKNKLILKHANT
jgi:hypothetical protein